MDCKTRLLRWSILANTSNNIPYQPRYILPTVLLTMSFEETRIGTFRLRMVKKLLSASHSLQCHNRFVLTSTTVSSEPSWANIPDIAHVFGKTVLQKAPNIGFVCCLAQCDPKIHKAKVCRDNAGDHHSLPYWSPFRRDGSADGISWKKEKKKDKAKNENENGEEQEERRRKQKFTETQKNRRGKGEKLEMRYFEKHIGDERSKLTFLLVSDRAVKLPISQPNVPE